MKATRSYKGRTIEVLLIPVRGGGWTAHFNIETCRGADVVVTRFETGQVFPTQEAALEASLRIGMRKIDSGFDEAPVAHSKTTPDVGLGFGLNC